VRRREFIAAAAGFVALPIVARAQPVGKVYRIGYLGLTSAAAYATRMDALRDGLAQLGYVEGKNIILEMRWADGHYDRLATLAAELVNLQVDVFVTHATPGVLAAKHATQIIPIVMTAVGDAVNSGLISSLARPGGNVTGMTFFNPELASKRLELLKEAVPGLATAAILLNTANPESNGPVLTAANRAGHSLNVELKEFAVSQLADFDGAFASMASEKVTGVVVTEDPILIANAETAAQLAFKYRIASCGFPEFAQSGGFVGYGVDFVDMWRRSATFIDKILKRTSPADIPVEQSTKFQTVINLKTAKAIGVEVPTSILLRADEVIE
jgi:putative tryptophan/tyrosine transport system substrate-binding protein